MAPAEKFGAVVADDQRGEVARRLLDAGVQHLDRVAADRVHLRMELDLEDAVAHVDQARPRVLSNDAAAREAGGRRSGSWRSGFEDSATRFDRPELPAEPPPHRLVDVFRTVGDLSAIRDA